ncbi:hypothetical protein ACOSQ4_008225 [Xanthoceras sorbifolium]
MVSEHENSTASASFPRAINTTHLINFGLKMLTPMKLELTVKLDHNNFMIWRQQIMAAIKGNRLFSFVDRNASPPERFNQDGSLTESYLDWEQQDQALLCWILSSISPKILPELIGCLTACEAWYSIDRMFSSQSKANTMQLKIQLQTLKKGSSSMTEYLMKKKSVMDALAFTGYQRSDEDKVMYILSGLGTEYDPFVISVTSVPRVYSVLEITALLLTHEA